VLTRTTTIPKTQWRGKKIARKAYKPRDTVPAIAESLRGKSLSQRDLEEQALMSGVPPGPQAFTGCIALIAGEFGSLVQPPRPNRLTSKKRMALDWRMITLP
jgi:hypothetical protein